MSRLKKYSKETVALAARFGISEAELAVYEYRKAKEMENAWARAYTSRGIEYIN